MVNENLARWITTSFYVTIRDALPAKTYHLYFEGEHKSRDYDDKSIEVRLDGPYFFELSKDYYKIHSELNILISTSIVNDIYAQDRVIGLITSIMSKPICIKKHGADTDDTGEFLFCMELSEANRSGLKVSKYGQVDKVLKIMQATIEGHYECLTDVKSI